jgi:hypothetical protein
MTESKWKKEAELLRQEQEEMQAEISRLEDKLVRHGIRPVDSLQDQIDEATCLTEALIFSTTKEFKQQCDTYSSVMASYLTGYKNKTGHVYPLQSEHAQLMAKCNEIAGSTFDDMELVGEDCPDPTDTIVFNRTQRGAVQATVKYMLEHGHWNSRQEMVAWIRNVVSEYLDSRSLF